MRPDQLEKLKLNIKSMLVGVAKNDDEFERENYRRAGLTIINTPRTIMLRQILEVLEGRIEL